MARTTRTGTAGKGTAGAAAGRTRAAGTGTVRAPSRPEITLPQLRPYGDEDREGEGGGGEEGHGVLRPGGDHDGVGFADLDLRGTDGAGATFLDCGLYRCALDEARLERARLIDTVLEGVGGVGTDLSGAQLRDVELLDARLGGVQAHGSRWSRVLVRCGKIDCLNLRQSTLTDVVFENCVLVEPDFGGAALERVAFPGSVLRGADFRQAGLRDVDLRDAVELGIATGADRLAGAVISSAQLMDLAPALAAGLGVRVES